MGPNLHLQVRRTGFWLIAFALLLPSARGQRLDTFLTPIRLIPNDPPAFVSSVANRVAIRGDIVYIADGYAGLAVYRLSQSSAPRLIGQAQTGEYTQTVRVDGDRAYTSDSLNGTVVFDVRDPAQPRMVPLSDLEAVARAAQKGPDAVAAQGNCVAALVGRHVYIAGDDFGVVEIELRSPRDALPPPFRAWIRHSMPASSVSGATRTVPLSAVSRPAFDEPSLAPGEPGGERTDLTAFAPPIATRAVLVDSAADGTELIASIEGGRLILRVTGPAGRVLDLERSASVAGPWQPWQTVVLGDLPLELSDSEAAGAEQIFYRVLAR